MLSSVSMVGKRKHKAVRAVLWVILGTITVIGVTVAATNAAVVMSGEGRIVGSEEAEQHEAQCILVLGASVLADGTPSGILQDRLDVAVQLYKDGVAPKMIMSGDNGEETYNEVLVMKNYAISKGVPSEDIFCDHAGFSTYESMYRAQDIFSVGRMVVVTQTYHLYRALYAANGLGIDAVGVSSDLNAYGGQLWFDAREVPARTKDFFQTLFKAPFAFDGEQISLDQSGDVTEHGDSAALSPERKPTEASY